MERRANVAFSRRGNPDQQGSGANRCNDVGGAVSQENQSQIGTVFLHGPSESCLGITCEMVGFVDHDDLEPLLRAEIHLLRLRNLFEQFLDDDSVILSDICGGDFQVVYRRDNVEF